MDGYPQVHEHNHSLSISFAPIETKMRHVMLKAVLDIADSSQIIGIEVINLAFQVGKNCLDIIAEIIPTKGDGLRYAYDKECDSFYLRLRSGKSIRQIVIQARVELNERDEIVEFNAQY